jgi:hypothetical protein
MDLAEIIVGVGGGDVEGESDFTSLGNFAICNFKCVGCGNPTLL